ncbi:hypothetical protein FGG08_007233 [Glutinoglossum americanum]|uniref:Thioredoxin domain-containing protein n=1 Tax=Glutinoglossum americanum TaxID=1670608 RepID=A0A9P8I1X5_9PEZI|nr:hypothetical protein FGG08_007233 [Glutinoglossum americanum]
MSSNKASWEEADFTPIAAFMRQSGEEVVRSLRVRPPMRVLDLGCGDGTTALPLARRGVDVMGIDIASNLVAAGRKRASEAGLHRLQFREGDACHLKDICDDWFDLTLSMFGAMFAPNPFDVAREMVRVTRPGGRIVMGNWIPGDPSFISQLRKISASLRPTSLPPTSSEDTLAWGVESHIVERFGQAGVPANRITMVKDTYLFTSPDKTPECFVEAFTRFYEPTFASAGVSNKLDEFQSQLLQLARAQNRSADGNMSLQLGDTAPDFTQDSTEGPIPFHQWAGDSWVVLFSHPKDFTPVCTTELGSVAKLKPEFDKRNVKVIGLSVDGLGNHEGWSKDIEETQGAALNFPLIADTDRKVSDLYGMIHPNADNTMTVRSVYVIGPDKKLKLTLTYPASTGRNFQEILRVIDSLQLTANYKVATPADWKHGEDVIITPAVSNEEAEKLFDKGFKQIKPYLRTTPQPNL